MGMMLTTHFSLEALIASDLAARKGINNHPPIAVEANLRLLAGYLERLRIVVGKTIHVNSGYRCLELNRLCGSKDTSSHVKGLAADLICPGFGSPLELCRTASIVFKGEYDQIIHEYGQWCHFGIRGVKEVSRVQLLTINEDGTSEGLV